MGYLRIKIGIFSEYSSGRAPAAPAPAAGRPPCGCRSHSRPRQKRLARKSSGQPSQRPRTLPAVFPTVSSPAAGRPPCGCRSHSRPRQKRLGRKSSGQPSQRPRTLPAVQGPQANVRPCTETIAGGHLFGCILVLFYIYLQPKRTIMAQTAFTVRMDSETKKRFDELCKDFGMSANTAFNIFARTVVKQEKIPFEVESEKERQEREGARKLGLALMELREDAQRRGLPEMSLEEINSFIKEVREDTKRNKGE